MTKRKSKDISTSNEAKGERLVVFDSPFAKPDVRIVVFASEFHVHAPVLKACSRFFKRFLEYSEGATVSKDFKFTFVSVVDDDGEWGLERESTAVSNVNELAEERTKAREAKTFQHMLDAMYGKPFELVDVDHLEHITRLADFLCALPAISKHLERVWSISPRFLALIPSEASAILPMAQKLRHGTLFKECLVYIVAQWSVELDEEWAMFYDGPKPPANPALDEDVFRSVQRACLEVTDLVLRVHFDVLQSMYTRIDFGRAMCRMGRGVISPDDRGSYRQHAEYFRNLRNSRSTLNLVDTGYDPNLSDRLDHVLRRNLVLLNISDLKLARNVERDIRDMFLCARFTDSDLPWDSTEMDW